MRRSLHHRDKQHPSLGYLANGVSALRRLVATQMGPPKTNTTATMMKHRPQDSKGSAITRGTWSRANHFGIRRIRWAFVHAIFRSAFYCVSHADFCVKFGCSKIPRGWVEVPTIPNDGIIGWIIFRLCLPVSSADIRCFISFFYYFSLVFACRYITTTYIHTKSHSFAHFEEKRKRKITS